MIYMIDVLVGILVIVLWRCGTYLGISIDEGVGAVSIDELIYSELSLIRTPEMWPPLYSGHSENS